ncbi:MAG: tyrosine-type recombinase/integrase [Promethearchaeota archaeon]
MQNAILSIDPVFETQQVRKFNEKNPEHRNRVRRLKFALSQKQRDELVERARRNPKHYAIIRSQLETGLRVGELANLTVPQVNLSGEPLIRVVARESDRYHAAWAPKTAAGNRRIPINASIRDLLAAQIGRRNVGYVFVSNKGGKYNEKSLIRMINKYAIECESIGHNIGSHALRRTYASVLNNEPETTIGDISRLLGHESVRTTMAYLYTIDDPLAFDRVRQATARMTRDSY